jgi:hypothetical protein
MGGKMIHRYVKISVGLLLVGISVALAMSPRRAAGQQSAVYPLVGSWNLSGTFQTTPPSPFLAVMNFDYGGTTAEFDTGGTNSSASPGESISLGTWKQTGPRTSQFVQRNYVYDENGNLAQLAITTANVTLDSPSGDTFKATASIVFDSCTVSQCPGPLLYGPFAGEFNGRKF